ncbi:MAG: cytochrome c-type biogenesis protein CcmH [Alphaproteobacteria bacterium]|jgi:cytochrome c-type biogenesis protein CcmH|nr:cytochrome c-type biogenesis protein CcmH [Alphaproteobacteria bacterium]
MTAIVTGFRNWIMMIMIFAGMMMLASYPLYSVQAILPEEQMADPLDESRARDLAAELRCLVCQNQTVDDSDADFAITIRSIIRDQISTGKSDDDILDFLRQRYGDYILFNPPLNRMTFILWLAPIILLIGGIMLIIITRPKNNPQSMKERGHDR